MNETIHSEKLYDLSLVEKVCRGNMATLRRMIQTFISTIPEAVEEIKAAHHRLDFETIYRTAHRIKPTLALYAMVKIEKDILRVEYFGKNEIDDNELNRIIGNLDQVVSSVVCSMKTEFSIN